MDGSGNHLNGSGYSCSGNSTLSCPCTPLSGSSSNTSGLNYSGNCSCRNSANGSISLNHNCSSSSCICGGGSGGLDTPSECGSSPCRSIPGAVGLPPPPSMNGGGMVGASGNQSLYGGPSQTNHNLGTTSCTSLSCLQSMLLNGSGSGGNSGGMSSHSGCAHSHGPLREIRESSSGTMSIVSSINNPCGGATGTSNCSSGPSSGNMMMGSSPNCSGVGSGPGASANSSAPSSGVSTPISAKDQLKHLFESCKAGDLVRVKQTASPRNVNARDNSGRRSTALHFAAGKKFTYFILLRNFVHIIASHILR